MSSKHFNYIKFVFLAGFSCTLFTFSSISTAKETAEARVTQIHSQSYNVASDGTQYTIANPSQPLALTIHPTILVDIDGGATARVKSWETWLKLKNSFGEIEFKDQKKTKSYSAFDRPKKVYKTITDISIPETQYSAFFVQQCNNLAARLKQNNSYSNKQIFSQDRTLEFYAQGKIKADFTANINLGTGFIQAHEPPTITVVCKKWQGSQHSASVGLVAEETIYVVTDSSLTLLPQSTKGGACNVTTSGVIKTLKPNAPVKFKYRHIDGHSGIAKDSQVYEVVTDHSKTAMFSHQFDIANIENKDEHGTLQMIGVSPEFNTKKKLYELACSTPSPSGLTTNLGPEVSAYYLIQERAQVGNQSCPVTVRLVGTVKTHGARRGKAIFVGDQYLSNAFNFNLDANTQQQFMADRAINWDLNNPQQGASHLAHGNTGGQALRFKDIRFGFNVSTLPAENNATTGAGSMLATPPAEDYTLAATTPQQTIRLQCEQLVQNQQSLSTPSSIQLQQAAMPKAKTKLPVEQTAPKAAVNRVQSNEKADIAIKAFNIAGNTFNKAGMVTLNARDAIRYENGRCLFDITYSIENKGKIASTPFQYQLTQERILINQHQNIILQANDFDSFYLTVGLRSGMNTLRLDADTDRTVIESNENNNHLTKQYTVMGPCQQTMKQLGSPKTSPSKNDAREVLSPGKMILKRPQ